MTYSSVLRVERRGVAIMAILNRPGVRNALNSELRGELARFWATLRDDPDLKVGVVTGAGDRAFSSGRDLKETAAAYRDGATETAAESEGRMGYPSDITVGKPVIAAINGYCLAAGLKLAFGCDMRIASTNAQFGNPQVKVGRGTDMPLRLLKAGIPKAVVMDMVMTGATIDAASALRWGLVSRVVEPADLREAAWSMATTIAENSPMVVGSVKRLLDDGVAELPMSQALDRWHTLPGFFGATADAREGALAFAEGRDGRYS